MKKLCKVNNEWKWIVFSEKEESDIREKHRVNSVEIYKQCLEDAKGIVGGDAPLLTHLLEVASTLFSKRCDAVYSVLQTALDDAIHDVQSKQ